MQNRGDGRPNYWWFVGPCLAIGGIVFGAGGMAYSTRETLTRQDKCIEVLSNKTAQNEVSMGRLDERLKAIDGSLARIESMMKERP